MTRKHFKEIAEIFKLNKTDLDTIQDFVKFCKRQNNNFDTNRFLEACGVEL